MKCAEESSEKTYYRPDDFRAVHLEISVPEYDLFGEDFDSRGQGGRVILLKLSSSSFSRTTTCFTSCYGVLKGYIKSFFQASTNKQWMDDCQSTSFQHLRGPLLSFLQHLLLSFLRRVRADDTTRRVVYARRTKFCQCQCETEATMISWSGRIIVGPTPIGPQRKILLSFYIGEQSNINPLLLLTGLGSKSSLLIGQSVRQPVKELKRKGVA
jgi:hypothetical protein